MDGPQYGAWSDAIGSSAYAMYQLHNQCRSTSTRKPQQTVVSPGLALSRRAQSLIPADYWATQAVVAGHRFPSPPPVSAGQCSHSLASGYDGVSWSITSAPIRAHLARWLPAALDDASV